MTITIPDWLFGPWMLNPWGYVFSVSCMLAYQFGVWRGRRAERRERERDGGTP